MILKHFWLLKYAQNKRIMSKLSTTTIEQSMKLLELGLDPSTANMWWDTNERYPRFIKHYHEYLSRSIPPIPVWTLSALLDILPNDIKRKDYKATDLVSDSENRYNVHIAKFQSVEGVTMYQISYGNCFTYSGDWKEMVSSPQSENLIDCIINMLEWIKENDFTDYYNETGTYV